MVKVRPVRGDFLDGTVNCLLLEIWFTEAYTYIINFFLNTYIYIYIYTVYIRIYRVYVYVHVYVYLYLYVYVSTLVIFAPGEPLISAPKISDPGC